MQKLNLSLFLCMLIFCINLEAYTPIKKYCPSCESIDAQNSPAPFLIYRGGPIVSSPKIINVLWGPNVNPEVINQMPQFLKDLVTSEWILGLTEYNTAGRPAPTTNQLIDFGKFMGQFEITPFNTNTSITDNDIQNELTAQLNAGTLPHPQYDNQGFLESIYIIEFPPNITISAFGEQSCVDFCAYHGSMFYKNKPIMYAVQPDLTVAGCNTGCGSGTLIQNQDSVHSHELAEAITDPEVSFNKLAWYDDNYGEIGDICNQQHGTAVLNGNTYTVQKEWSNIKRLCETILPFLTSPSHFTGKVTKQKHGTKTTYSHVLTWNPSPDHSVAGYRIVVGNKVAANIPAKGPYKVTFTNRNPKLHYTYNLVAFSADGSQSKFLSVTLP